MTPLNRASAASGKANCRFGGALRRSPLKLQKLGRKKRSQCRLLQPSDTLCGRSVCFLKRSAANCWLEPPVISTWPKPQNLSALRFRPFCHDFPVFPWETPLANSAGRIVFRGNIANPPRMPLDLIPGALSQGFLTVCWRRKNASHFFVLYEQKFLKSYVFLPYRQEYCIDILCGILFMGVFA